MGPPGGRRRRPSGSAGEFSCAGGWPSARVWWGSALARLGLAAQQDAATPAATSSAAQDATPKIAAVANTFLDTLGETEREAVLFDWTDTAQQQRWSNLPEGLFERDGLMWGDQSETQQDAWLGLMQAALSTEGYDQIIAEWNADDALEEDDGGGDPPAGGFGDGTPPGGGPGGGAPGQLLYGTHTTRSPSSARRRRPTPGSGSGAGTT